MKVIGGQVFPAEQNRDNIVQATTSITTGTETTILAALSGYYHDMIVVTGHNGSDAAVTLEIRDETGGTVRTKITIPAASAKSWIYHIPYKQTEKNNNWTADMGDYTNTTITMYIQAVKKK